MSDLALNAFLTDIRIPALKYAQLRLQQEETALDLLQEAMIDFVSAKKKDSSDEWRGLFYKILNRRIADWHRKQYRRHKLLQIISFGQLGQTDEESQPEIADHHCGEMEYRAEELEHQFQQALQTLPARQQEAYLLRQWNGFSVKQTAAAMECSEGSVKTHLSRAMSALREALGEWINEESE
ncbi:MAG: sigma-70 family RNA polymerase sigma factor [Gammaproteobacteria bacterium]|nr:sigma-70 family RNA polymerase sigma factor [Gammaproteobacteria bacterium]